jgi:hypothetical protein
VGLKPDETLEISNQIGHAGLDGSAIHVDRDHHPQQQGLQAVRR